MGRKDPPCSARSSIWRPVINHMETKNTSFLDYSTQTNTTWRAKPLSETGNTIPSELPELFFFIGYFISQVRWPQNSAFKVFVPFQRTHAVCVVCSPQDQPEAPLKLRPHPYYLLSLPHPASVSPSFWERFLYESSKPESHPRLHGSVRVPSMKFLETNHGYQVDLR